MGAGTVNIPARRANGLWPAVIALAAAGAFFGLARWAGEAPLAASWGGAAWVFLLSLIVSLPLLTGRATRRANTSAVGGVGASLTLALAVWACTLPFVFLLVAPLLGARAAVTTALALLVGISVVCLAVRVTGGARRA